MNFFFFKANIHPGGTPGPVKYPFNEWMGHGTCKFMQNYMWEIEKIKGKEVEKIQQRKGGSNIQPGWLSVGTPKEIPTMELVQIIPTMVWSIQKLLVSTTMW